MKSSGNERVKASCAEFIFGANYAIPDLKSIHNLYREIKRNHVLMNDPAMNAFCQVLVKGDNSFDRNQAAIEGTFGCDFCSQNSERIQRVKQKVDQRKREMEGMKRMVQDLRNSKAKYEGNLVSMRSETESMDRRKEVIMEEMKEIEAGIFTVNRDILEMEKRERIRERVLDGNVIVTRNMDERLWTRWNCHDVMEWILSLENGRFGRYIDEIMERMLEENVRGSELGMINQDDLEHFGIESAEDRESAMRHIQRVISRESKVHFPGGRVVAVNQKEGV